MINKNNLEENKYQNNNKGNNLNQKDKKSNTEKQFQKNLYEQYQLSSTSYDLNKNHGIKLQAFQSNAQLQTNHKIKRKKIKKILFLFVFFLIIIVLIFIISIFLISSKHIQQHPMQQQQQIKNQKILNNTINYDPYQSNQQWSQWQKNFYLSLYYQKINLQLQQSQYSSQINQRYFPALGLNLSKLRQVNQFDRNQMKIKNISLQSLQLARKYLTLGFHEPSQSLITQQKQYYQKKYQLQKNFKENLNSLQFPFCIIIPSYNNAQNMRYAANLASIFRQDYQNYHIVYIDDFSTDNTPQLVKQYIKIRKFPKEKFTLVQNKFNKGPLQNQYQSGINYCGKYQIYIIIDGDDFIIGTQVFKLLNYFYQNTDNWFIYSNFLWVFSQNIGVGDRLPNHTIQNKTYRDQFLTRWCTSHLKTVYNQILLKINKNNLIYDKDIIDSKTGNNMKGQYFKVNADRALVYPIVQISGKRVQYLSQILYIYISNTAYSEGKKQPMYRSISYQMIVNKKKQQQLQCLFQQKDTFENNQSNKVKQQNNKIECQKANQFVRFKLKN